MLEAEIQEGNYYVARKSALVTHGAQGGYDI
jgi:hypothetical protein